ncbi:MAG: glycosyltransferase [Flavobacterium sp.]|nr:glycosyltransferase [Flavobacterium sp.]
MLSILIPVYNYDIRPLVTELQRQCATCAIDYEILVQDDASETFTNENGTITNFNFCSYTVHQQNQGRSSVRNMLAHSAQFDNLLFLDADTMPVSAFFISNYICQITSDEKIVYGGIVYQMKKPENSKVLRWIYGKKREALAVVKRNAKPYVSFLTLNFLIKKSIFKKVNFNENIPNLRHEDTLFSFDLMKNKIKIVHIDNPIVHLGLDLNDNFIIKSEKAIDNLHYLITTKLIDYRYVRLAKMATFIKKSNLQFLVSTIFTFIKPVLLKNMRSNKPSLPLFDLYRLGYFCQINID